MLKNRRKCKKSPNSAKIPRGQFRKWVQCISRTRKPYDSHQNFDSKCHRKKVSLTTYELWRPSWILGPRPPGGQFFFVLTFFFRNSIVIRSYLCWLKSFTERCTHHPPTSWTIMHLKVKHTQKLSTPEQHVNKSQLPVI